MPFFLLYLIVARGRADQFERYLGGTVRAQQTVRFLEGVAELGVAQAAEHGRGIDHREQAPVQLDE